jgi:hypothetical protein
MRKQLFAVAIAAAGALLAVAPSLPASAASPSVLTVGSAGGTAANAKDTVTAGLLSGTDAVLSTSSGNITCTQSTFTASVTSNPTAPGTADESLTAQTFAGCTAKITGVESVKSISVLNLPYVAAVSDSSDTLTLTAGSSGALEVSAALNTLIGTVTCDFTASSLTGTTSNSNNSITFSSQSTTLLSGPGVCPKSGTFSAAYGPVEDTTQGNGLVFVN